MRLNFKFEVTEEQANHLKKLAVATGQPNIQSLFGFLVTAGVNTLTASLDRARSDALTGAQEEALREAAGTSTVSDSAELPSTATLDSVQPA